MSQIPYQPQNIILQTGNGQNLLSWDITVGATSYSVQRSTDGVNFTVLGTSTKNSYVDAFATVGTLYYYTVASVSVAGISAYGPSSPTSITPCLPGQISLGYLRYFSQLGADKLNSPFVTTDEWNFYINQSIYELYDILVDKYGDDYFFAPPLLITTNGSQSYPLPDGSNYPVSGVPSPACYKLNGVDANISGGAPGPNAGWVALARFNWSDRNKYSLLPGQTGVLSNCMTPAYREMGNMIQIIPQNTANLLRIWYVPIMTQLLQDTDMLAFSISGWSEYVINDASIKALLKEESFEQASALQLRKQSLLARIESSANNRDVGQANTVSNTRATMGDPGFSNGFGYGSGFGFNGSGGFG